MDPDQWRRGKEIFGEAIDLEPGLREAYVREASNGDVELIAHVMSLLKMDSPDPSFKNPIEPPSSQQIVLDERYRLEKEIGRGGFGIVFLASDLKLHDRRVVVKMLLTQSPTWATEKFAKELEAITRIGHPGVVGALDRGNCPDGRPFIVMQFIEGQSLRDVIVAGGMSLARVADISSQIGSALGAAHAKGVWHRDLKPENIMFQPLPNGGELACLIDFGIATVKDAHDAAKEVETRAVGSLSYMAPEQLSGHVSNATDLYAFGLIVYEMITGSKPFAATTPGERLAQQAAGVLIKPTSLRHDLSPAAEQLVLQALAYRAADRPQEAARFSEQLAGALAINRTRRPMPRRNALLMVVGGSLTAGIAGIVWREYSSLPAPTLTYSLLMQNTLDGEPVGLPQFLPVGRAIRTSDSFILLVRTSQKGHLYMLSEDSGNDSINILFPAPFMYSGSSYMNVDELKRIPEQSSFAFDSNPGVSMLWIVWSVNVIRQLEELQKWINERDKGAVGDAGDRARVRAELAKWPQATSNSEVARSEQTVNLLASPTVWKIKMETKP